MDNVKVTCWGSRGSCPAPHRSRIEYGGNTTCFVIETDSAILALDGGTGIASWGDELLNRKQDGCVKEIHIFLSHLHLDHIIGLPFFKPLNREDYRICFYGEERDGKSLQEQLATVFSPPYWPVRLDHYAASIRYTTVKTGRSLSLPGGISIETFRANHPDQTVLYAFYINGRKIVYGLDCEIDEKTMGPLTGFTEEADLLICDAQYSPGEYARHQGWGHSTWKEGSELARRSHTRHVWFTHFAWEADDEKLKVLELDAQGECPEGIFVREGMEILL